MLFSGLIAGITAVVSAYLVGSISGAYIITRVVTGKDIRKLGGGNAGSRNVYRSVGLWAAIPAVIIDVGKGAGAVAIADFVLGAPTLFIPLAGLAAVAGHIWPIYLKFRGGNGLAPCLGVLSLILTRELLIVLGIMLVIMVLTRNPVLGLNIGLLSLPASAWLLEKSWLAVVFSVALIAMMALRFMPTLRDAISEAGGRKRLLANLMKGGSTGPQVKDEAARPKRKKR